MEVASSNSIDIAYTRKGKGVPLVLIHGYPLDHSIWDRVIPLLTDTFDLIVPDLRGFGESRLSGREAQMSDYAADIAGLLDALDLRQAALAGHSMGGYVALAFARDYAARVRGLALISSQGLADPPDRKEGRIKSAQEVEEKGVGGVAESMAPKLSVDPALQSMARELILKQGPDGVAAALRAMADRPDSMDLLKAFKLPLVLVHGDTDALIPIDRAREVESAVLQARLVTLAGVGHLPMLEAPEKTAEALKHLA